MAEGFAHKYLVGWEVNSAGLEAHGLNPMAVKVMSDSGIDISGQESAILTASMLAESDLIVTVCGHADEHCPAIAGAEKLHWPFDDPARITGSEAEIVAGFCRVRDAIERQIKEFSQSLMT